MSVIHATVFKPHNSLFKQFRNDRATCQIVICKGYDNCGLYKRNECCWLNGIGWTACPYGNFNKSSGFTRQARKYMDWINEKENEYRNVLNKLSQASNVMAEIGEYVFLPYSWITMNKQVPFKSEEGYFRKGNCLLSKTRFNIESIISICEFRPQAMMGGEIKAYQQEQIPKFIKHLSECYPNRYKKLCEKYPRAKEFNLSNVGRKAFLYTLNSNVGKFIDCHKAEWVWNGEYLISQNSKASFMLVDNFSELRLKPAQGCIVTITDDKQVNGNTQFYKS